MSSRRFGAASFGGWRPLALGVPLALLAGCATIPDEVGHLTDGSQYQQERARDWGEDRVPVRYVFPRGGQPPFAPSHVLPDRLAQQKLDLRFPPNATLEDLGTLLSLEGFPVHVHETLKQISLGRMRFQGSIQSLADYLTEVLEVSVTYRGGTLILSENGRYVVQTPQNEAVVKKIAKKIEKLDGTDVHGDVQSGMVTYRATPRVHRAIRAYLDRIKENTALVELQVALLDVRLRRERGTGFDWGALRAQVGDLARTASGSVEDGAEAMAAAANGLQSGESRAELAGQQMILRGERGDFSLEALVRLLSTYGETRTEQDITLTTLAGSPVEIRSGNSVPYVDEVSTTSSGEGSTQSGAEIETQDTGLTVQITPHYDASEHLVTSAVDLDISDVVAMREFAVGGEEGGTLTHPELQESSFTNIARLIPGESILIGGIAYDQAERNLNSLAGLERMPVGGEQAQTERHAIFILLRPTVTIFASGDSGDQQSNRTPVPGATHTTCSSAPAHPATLRLQNMETVYFPIDKANIRSRDWEYLRGLARQILNRDLKVAVRGYTDPSGTERGNDSLARDRRRALRDALVDLGVPGDRFVKTPAQNRPTCDLDVPRRYQRRGEIYLLAGDDRERD